MPIVSAGNDCGPPMRLDDSRDRERLDQVGELKTFSALEIVFSIEVILSSWSRRRLSKFSVI